MNKLSFGILGFLAEESLTGYDLLQKMNLFWRTTHSRIYPLLKELEHLGHIVYKVGKQKDKPDKKIYSITENGMALIQEWLTAPSDEPVTRDEMFLKGYCIHLFDPKEAERLLKHRAMMFLRKMESHQALFNDFLKSISQKINTTNSANFSKYILFQRMIAQDYWEIRWCQWVYDLYHQGNNFKMLNNPLIANGELTL